ncbi:MAG: sigma 54-interacting transcriptional regulator [Gammaproteobacteria bacterium]
MIGESEVLRRCVDLVSKIASCDAPVLLEGETGTGKLRARAVNWISNSAKPISECS